MIKKTKEPPTEWRGPWRSAGEIVDALREAIFAENIGNRDADGVNRDAESLNAIECFKAAIQIIRFGAKNHNRARDGKDRSKR